LAASRAAQRFLPQPLAHLAAARRSNKNEKRYSAVTSLDVNVAQAGARAPAI